MSEAAKAELGRLVTSALEDGEISDAERTEMRHFFQSAALTVPEVKEVFSNCISALRDEALADGVLTQSEIASIKNAVEQLKIPPRFLPEAVADMVTGKTKPHG